jgi:hypothetical protein
MTEGVSSNAGGGVRNEPEADGCGSNRRRARRSDVPATVRRLMAPSRRRLVGLVALGALEAGAWYAGTQFEGPSRVKPAPLSYAFDLQGW